MMNTVLGQYLGAFRNAYIGDAIVYSRTQEQHVEHLVKLLQTFSDAKFKVSEKISEFFKSQVVFLGCVFNGVTRTTIEYCCTHHETR